ncbi:MAG: hypothetical protein IJ748_05195 [Bacteroidales bacterium]|nr:hypothetical protein [Bacteroidales bacterium]
MDLWNNDTEIRFFKEALNGFASVEKLFYKLKLGSYAYVPKEVNTEGKTLQSRNSLIGHFTENWCKNLIEPIAKKHGLFAVNSVVCEEIGLTRQSSADLVISKKDTIQQTAKDIKIIFEIKMSIISNYLYNEDGDIKLIGDYKTHRGNPSLLRSDSMLKAIGKSVDIRVCGEKSANIPIIILGNSPITANYKEKVDQLKQSGVIQNFISLNPNPSKSNFIKESKTKGFITPKDYREFEQILDNLLNFDFYYFSAMKSKNELGKLISLAAREKSDIERADKFLQLIKV